MSLEENLTPEELATNAHTWRHIWNLQRFMSQGILTEDGYNIPSILYSSVRSTLSDTRDHIEPATYQKILADPTLTTLWSNTEKYVWHMARMFSSKGHSNAYYKLVQFIINDRLLTHDQSKLVAPELTTFVEYTPKLKHIKFGSAEYQECLDGMKPALDNHYANNRHHPEHYKNGIIDMTFFDLYEMMCDWIASSLRTKEGSFQSSVKFCTERFNIDSSVINLLLTTFDQLFKDEYARDPSSYYSQRIESMTK